MHLFIFSPANSFNRVASFAFTLRVATLDQQNLPKASGEIKRQTLATTILHKHFLFVYLFITKIHPLKRPRQLRFIFIFILR
jgi:hypothetical protein